MRYDKDGARIYPLLELNGRLSAIGGNIALICIASLIYGVLRMRKHEPGEWQGTVMLIWAALSLVSAFSYSTLHLIFKGKVKALWLRIFYVCLPLIPYLFGCFLIAYKGLLPFVRILSSFTLKEAAISIIWLFSGIFLISQFCLMNRMGRMLDNGRIKIEG